MATIFRPPLITRGAARAGLRQAAEVGRNIALLSAVVAAPFIPNDWQNPRGKVNHAYLETSYGVSPATLLTGQKPFTQLEQPNPQRRPVRELTHLQRAQLPAAAPAQAPFNPVQNPNPGGRAFPVALRTALQNGQLYTADNVPPSTTLTELPARRSYAAALAQPGVQYAIYYPTGPVAPPFFQTSHPNPQLRRVSHAYFGLTNRAQLEYLPVGVSMLPLQWMPKWPVALNANPQAGALRASFVPLPPFLPVDAPNPRGPQRSIALRTHLSSLPLPFVTGPKPPLAFDLPNPRGRIPAISLRTFTNSLNTSTLAPPPGKPFAQYDWPVPRGRAPLYNRGMVGWMQIQAPATPLKPVGDPFMSARVQVPAKLPSEVRVETIDASPFLQIGQTITGAVGAIGVYSGTDPDYADVLGTVTFAGNNVFVQLLDGVQGVIYIVTIYVSVGLPLETIPVSFFLAIAPELP